MKTVLTFLSVIILIFLLRCDWFTTPVEYQVNCSTPGFDVTYTDKRGEEKIEEIQDTIWKKKIEARSNVKYITVTGESYNNNLGDKITVRIYVFGELEDKDTDTYVGYASTEL